MSSSDPSPSDSQHSDAQETSRRSDADEFEQLAQEEQTGLIREFIDFALENKKWWLIPIMLVLLLVAAFIFISGAAGPFIYPLF